MKNPAAAAVKREGGGGLVSFIARMTTITNSACRRVLVFWKTDLRQVRAVSYLIPSAFAQDRSDFPVIRRATGAPVPGTNRTYP